MDEQKLAQYIDASMQALSQGINEQQLMDELSKEMSPEEAQQVVQIAKEELAGQQQGGGEQQGGEGQPQRKTISVEEAAQFLQELQVDPKIAFALIEMVLNMKPKDVDQLLAMLQQAIQQGGQQQQQQQ